MKLIDYIVYRLYTVYEKHKDPGRLSAFGILLFMSLIGLIFLELYITIISQDEYLIMNTISYSEHLYILLGVIFANIILFFSRYTKKRIEQLKLQFKGNTWNKTIPNYLILTLPIWEILLGIGIYFLLKKHYQYGIS